MPDRAKWMIYGANGYVGRSEVRNAQPPVLPDNMMTSAVDLSWRSPRLASECV